MKAGVVARILVALVAVSIAAVMCRRLMTSGDPHVEPDRGLYPVRGIDISGHNGPVDFDRLCGDSIDFVYIKASEGASWRDTLFETNYRAALASGIAVGVYHFFRFNTEGWRQSVNILRAIDGRHLDLPVAIDVEEWGNPGEYTTDRVVDNLRSMVELLRQAGREVIIYTNKNGYYRFVRGRFDDVPLWICGFTDPPIRDRRRWTMWQHSHRGRVEGVSGNVDLNTFNTPARGTFAEYLASRPSVATLH